MKKLILPVLLVSFVFSTVSADYKAGIKYFRMKNYKKANEEFTMDVETYRTYWFFPAYYSGRCFLKMKDYDSALQMLRVSEEGAANSENKVQEMALIKITETEVLIAQKKLKSAINLATKYIPQSPADQQAELYYFRGYAYSKQKQFSKAINDFKQSLALFNKKSGKISLANYQLGYAYANNNNYQSAIAPLEKALKIRKSIKPAYYLLTDIYLNIARLDKNEKSKKNKYLKAVDWAQKGLNVYRNNKKLMLNLGNANLGSKQYDNAISVFDRLLKKYSNDVDILFGLGSAYMGKKEFKDALPYLKKAQMKMRKDAIIYTYISSAYLSISKDYKKDVDKKLWVNKAIDTLKLGLKNCGNESSLKSKMNEAKGMFSSISQNLETINENIKAMQDNLFKLQDRVTVLNERIRKSEEVYRRTGTYPKSHESDLKDLEDVKGKIVTVKREISKLQKEVK